MIFIFFQFERLYLNCVFSSSGIHLYTVLSFFFFWQKQIFCRIIVSNTLYICCFMCVSESAMVRFRSCRLLITFSLHDERCYGTSLPNSDVYHIRACTCCFLPPPVHSRLNSLLTEDPAALTGQGGVVGGWTWV